MQRKKRKETQTHTAIFALPPSPSYFPQIPLSSTNSSPNSTNYLSLTLSIEFCRFNFGCGGARAVAASMRSIVANLWRKFFPEKVDQFDRLPDEIILSIFKRIGDATALGRCCAVSRRFHSIAPQVDDVVVHVGSITLEEEDRELASSHHPIASFFRILFNPLLSLAQLIIPSACLLPLLKDDDDDDDDNDDDDDDDEYEYDDETVSLWSMKNVMKNFTEIKRLWIELSAGEVAINDGVLLKLKAEYSSTLESCVILAASSVADRSCSCDDAELDDDDLDSLHESFYSEQGLEQRVTWIANSLIATSTRHHLLHPMIAEHKTLETLVLTDADGQGLLTMDREQLEEMRARPFTSAPLSSTRIAVPSLEVQLWYAPRLEMPEGVVLKGATLIAIRPREREMPVGPLLSWAEEEGNWIVSAFEGPYGDPARVMAKERRIYGLNINAF
ncbi:F-box protein At4g18380-like [Salvia hispanica]|uniref:F-box protein At4g18380-like n=1 Tax=Salvia hispanica TaxID=49212 RepID=UPI002009155E|nr:F-box protein At4g18380-like [Salvia hispanica]